jgi:serine/threonine protein kinase
MKYPINIHDYMRDSKLGQGTFSEVFLYKNVSGKYSEKVKTKHNELVVKVVHPKYFKYTLKELDFLRKIKDYNNPYIIEFIGDQIIKGDVRLFFFEKLSMNLYTFYKRRKHTITDIITISYQMLKGIEFIHSLNVIHGDLKPENVLIDETTMKTKLIDFGSIIDKKKLTYKNFYVSTRYYRAPEIIYNLMFNEKIDIWSIGCIIAELVRNKPLFTAKNEDRLFEFINDLLGTPKDILYTCAPNYYKRFVYEYSKNRIPIYKDPFCFKLKFTRYLELYKINGLQKKMLIDLFKSIFIYDFYERVSATECLKSPLFLEFKINN